MVKKISLKIFNIFFSKKNIISEEKDMYVFGIYQIIILFSNIVNSIIISLMMKMFIECFVLSMSYFSLRVFYGGFHFKNSKVCYVISSVLIAFLLGLIKIINVNFIFYITFVIWDYILFFLGPVDTQNRRFTFEEKEYFKKRGSLILIFQNIIMIISVLLNNYLIIKIIYVGIFAAAFMALAGLINNKLNLYFIKKKMNEAIIR